jgi:GNAT superfamily N-acetyltransferase
VIRERRASDADILVPALGEVHRRDGYPIMQRHVSTEWLFGGDVARAWVAEFDNEPIAHISVVNSLTAPGLDAAALDGPNGILGLTRLFVTPAGRGKGAASALIATVEDYATDANSPLALEVVEHNLDAIALYERRGWQRINSYRSSWFGEDGPHPISHVYLAPA